MGVGSTVNEFFVVGNNVIGLVPIRKDDFDPSGIRLSFQVQVRLPGIIDRLGDILIFSRYCINLSIC